MLRNILVLFPALAFALPIVASQSTQARPLATPVEEATFCWGDCPGAKPTPTKPGKPGKGGDVGGDDVSLDLALEFCMAVQVLAENRACEIKDGDACFAACDDLTVAAYCDAAVGDGAACVEDTVRSCRSSCESDGAAFCEERYKPGKKPGKKPAKPGKKPDTGDDDGGGSLIFVNVEQCFALGINVDIQN